MERNGSRVVTLSRVALGGAVCAVVSTVVSLVGTANAQTFAVRVRWAPSASSGVAGYRVYQRPLAGSYGVPYDAGLPAPAADGTLGYIVAGLETTVSYAFRVTAYTAEGTESAPSNELVLPASTSTTSTTTTTSSTTTTRPSTTTTTVSTTTTTRPSTTTTSTTTTTRPSTTTTTTATSVPPTTTTTLPGGILPRTAWRLVYVDSQELVAENGAAVNAFDGDPLTIWHSKWSPTSDPLPHEIQIDLGATYAVSGFRYLPRPSGSNGRIRDWEFYVAASPGSWGTPAATGTFADSGAEKAVVFTARSGRYVRLRALTEVNGNPWTSMAELTVLGSAASSTTSTSTTLSPTTTTIAGGAVQPAPDWTGAFRAVFRLDESSGVRRNAPGATCGSKCDLEDRGGVGRYTADHPEGAGAADLVRSTPSSLGRWLSDPSGFNISGSLAIGCWARPTFSAAHGFLITRENGADAGYRLYRTPEHRYAFLIGDGSDRVFCTAGAAGQFATGRWQHVVGVFDDEGTLGGGADRMYLFADGAQTGPPCTQQALARVSWTFRLGDATTSHAWGGQLDECFVRAGVLTPAQVCRIKSCGIDGTRCLCSGSAYAPCTNDAQCGSRGICDRTSNTCRGYNGGTCTLPACNAPPPVGGARAARTDGDEEGEFAGELRLRRAGSGRQRVRLRGVFSAVGACDPAADGVVIRLTAAGGVVHEAALPASAFRRGRGRADTATYVVRGTRPLARAGVRRLELRLAGGQGQLAVDGTIPRGVAPTSDLGLRIEVGLGCTRDAGLACVTRRHAMRCRTR